MVTGLGTWLSHPRSRQTPSAVLGFTGGWGIRQFCTQTPFLPPRQHWVGAYSPYTMSSCAAQAPAPADPPPHALQHSSLRAQLSVPCATWGHKLHSPAALPSHFTERKLRLGSSLSVAPWWQRWDFHSGTSYLTREPLCFCHTTSPNSWWWFSPGLGVPSPGLLLGLSSGLRSPCVCDCTHGC